MISSKQVSYQIFKKVCIMMQEKKHLTLEGVLQILELAYLSFFVLLKKKGRIKILLSFFVLLKKKAKN